MNKSIWHARVGHLSNNKLKNMKNFVERFCVKTTSASDCAEQEIYEGCMNGKSSVQPFQSSGYGMMKTNSLLELVHSDVVEPIHENSQGGAKYMVTFIDNYSRLVHYYFIQTKLEVLSKFFEFKAPVETQHGTRNKCLRTDNGGEYINQNFSAICKKAGIVNQTTVPYSPQQNGLAKRLNRRITERARCMLSHMQVEGE